MIAQFDGVCPRCGGDITKGNANPNAGPLVPPSNVVKHGADTIHATCAPGGDDEDSLPLDVLKRLTKVAPVFVATPEAEQTLEVEGDGLIYNLDERLYHGHQGSLSHSGAKLILQAPAKFLYRQTHPEHKDVFDFGSAAHKLALGEGPMIVEIEADSWRTKAAGEQRDAARAAGKIPLLSKDLRKVEDMADVLTKHRRAVDLLTGGRSEVSAFAVDEPTGVLRRARIDHLHDDLAVDYKSTVCCDPQVFARSAVAQFGYHSQAAWYLDLLRDLDLPIRGFLFVAQEKEPPYLVECMEIALPAVEIGRERNRRALQMFRDCTASGLWPGYNSDDTITPIDVPTWAYYEETSA